MLVQSIERDVRLCVVDVWMSCRLSWRPEPTELETSCQGGYCQVREKNVFGANILAYRESKCLPYAGLIKSSHKSKKCMDNSV